MNVIVATPVNRRRNLRPLTLSGTRRRNRPASPKGPHKIADPERGSTVILGRKKRRSRPVPARGLQSAATLNVKPASNKRNTAGRRDLLWTKVRAPGALSCEICILAGGLSTRMGRDKARLKFGKQTVLGNIHKAALATGFPVRIIRRDIVPRCGPLGGVFTALASSKAEFCLFLACDMPFVSPALMLWLLKRVSSSAPAIFVMSKEGPGFPFVLHQSCLAIIKQQIRRGRFSVSALAQALKARMARLPAKFTPELLNINTPRDWEIARRLWHARC